MDASLIYLVVVCGVCVTAGLGVLAYSVCRWVARAARSFSAHFRHAPPNRRGLWRAIARADALAILLYAAVNGWALGFSVHDITKLEQRAATVASVNFLITFLGGRTNPFTDFFQVPLRTHYLVHHWAGRIGCVEAILHGALVLHRQHALDEQAISGYIVRDPAFPPQPLTETNI